MKVIIFSIIFSIFTLINAEDTLLVKQAKAMKFTSCLSVIEDVEYSLFNVKKGVVSYGIKSFVSHKNPKNEFLSAIVEATIEDDSSRMYDILIIPNNIEKKCTVYYTKTWSSDKSCLDVAKKFKNYKLEALLNKNTLIFKHSKKEVATITLETIKNGCLVQRRDIFFRVGSQ